MSFSVRQTHSIDADGVRRIVADHYAAMGMEFSASHVSFQVHASHRSGMSSSPTRLGDTTIRVPAAIHRPGAPSSMTLAPADVQTIVAQRLTEVLGFEVTPGSVVFNVRDGGGSGFSRSGPSMDGIVVTSTISVG